MRLLTGGWFSEPKIDFKISHKVNSLLRDTIINDLLIPKGVYNVNDKDFVGIQVTTKSHVIAAKLEEPIIDEKNNFTSYSFSLPYKAIANAPCELEAYLHYFFILLEEFLSVYDIHKPEIVKVEAKIKSIVLNNDDYAFVSLDNVFDIDDILKGIDLNS
jgi:hypothetical protein